MSDQVPPPPPPQDPTPQPPQQPYAPPAAAANAPLTQEQDVQWASFAHLGGILSFLPSLIIWLIFKDRGPFTNQEAKEALNFQITLAIVSVALWIIVPILVAVTLGFGFFLTILFYVPWIYGVVYSIIAFLKVKEAVPYRYPINFRFIK